MAGKGQERMDWNCTVMKRTITVISNGGVAAFAPAFSRRGFAESCGRPADYRGAMVFDGCDSSGGQRPRSDGFRTTDPNARAQRQSSRAARRSMSFRHEVPLRSVRFVGGSETAAPWLQFESHPFSIAIQTLLAQRNQSPSLPGMRCQALRLAPSNVNRPSIPQSIAL